MYHGDNLKRDVNLCTCKTYLELEDIKILRKYYIDEITHRGHNMPWKEKERMLSALSNVNKILSDITNERSMKNE